MTLVDLILDKPNWLEEAACRGTEPGLFFPDGTTTQDSIDRIVRAKSVCNECACKTYCLEYAIKTNQDSGIWGGKSEVERRQIRRDLRNKQIKEVDISNF